MKNYKTWGFALLVAVIGIAFAFTKTAAPKMETVYMVDESGVESTTALPSSTVMKAFRRDTIINALNDTLPFTPILASAYQYCFQIAMTNISGTRNVRIYLEQTAVTGSNRFMKVDSAITTLGVPNYMMRGQNVWGNRYRIIVDGTGTQSTAYQIDAIVKRTE